MSNNNKSILILRGGPNYDISKAGEILLDGQPFYSKKTTEFFIGNGKDAIKDLQPVKALTDLTYNSNSDVAQSGKAVAQAITPLTDEQIDDMWEELPALDSVPTFDMTSGYIPVWNGITFKDGKALTDVLVDQSYSKTSSKAQSGKAVAQAVTQNTINFGYSEYTVGDKFPIKRNGYYMVYCNSGNLRVMEEKTSGTFEPVISGAKLILMMASPITRKPDANTFGAAGTYWTGQTPSIMNLSTIVNGFRTSLKEGSYIDCNATSGDSFWIFLMVKGDLVRAEGPQTKILFIGNSHSQDTFMPLSEIFYAEGQENYIFGLCKKEGSSVPDHVNNINNVIADYHYYESIPNSDGTYSNPFGRGDDGNLTRVTMDKILEYHKWDYVFILGSPMDLTDDTVVSNDRQEVVNYIKEFLPNAKIGFCCPWLAPYSDDASDLQNLTGVKKEWYDAYVTKGGNTVAGKYGVIYNNTKNNLLSDNTYSMISASCTPIYYANQILGINSNILYRDVLHMSKDLGRVLVAYTFYSQFMQAFEGLETLNQLKLERYNLGSYDITTNDKNIILESVNYTLQDPWVIPTERVQ